MQRCFVKCKESGFTLVELLVAVAISGGVILGAMAVFSQVNKGTQSAYIDGNISETVFAIDQALSTKAGCIETFVKPGNVKPGGAGTKIDKVFFKENSVLFQTGSPIGQIGASHSVSIVDMTLKNYVPAAVNRGLAHFDITIRAKGKKDLVKKIVVGLEVKNDLVVGCVNRGEPTTDCIGSWGNCSEKCDGGTQQYNISLLEKNGGESCSNTDKETRACNTHSCSAWVTSAWGSCTGGSGFWTYDSWGSCTGKMVSSTGPYCDGTTFYFCTSCGWVGTQTKSATCNFSANSGTQTRVVTCQKNGITVADSECKDAKPAVSQQCTPSNSSVCGPQNNPPRNCTPSEPNPCTFTEECAPQGPC